MVNPMSFMPEDLDYLEIDYGWIIRSVIRHRDLEGAKPFKDWDRYPLTAAFTVRGCYQQCAVCGGSCSAMDGFLGRRSGIPQPGEGRPGHLRHPDLPEGADLRGRGHRQGGKDYAQRFSARRGSWGWTINWSSSCSPRPMSSTSNWSPARTRATPSSSPRTPIAEVRNALGRRFDTASMEKSVGACAEHDCRRFDMFFMIGLPRQDKQSALDSARYSKRLYSLVDNDPRLFVFTSPLAPFLDPGSYAFENADEVGYRLFARTLEEHRARLTSPSWKYVLSYETKWMTRDDIVDASYDAADILNRTRSECGLIGPEELAARIERTSMARNMMHDIDLALAIKDTEERQIALDKLRQKGEELMESTICQKRDLEWESSSIFKSVPRAMLGLARSKRRKRSPKA